MARVTIVLVLVLALPALAQPKKGTGTEAVVSAMIEDVDALNTVTAGHTREIANLKQKTDELADKIGPGVREVIAPVVKDVDTLKNDVGELKKEVSGIKELLDRGAKKLFWITPIFELRIRPEYQRNRTDMSSSSKDQDLYYLQRLRFGLKVEPVKGVRGVVVAQDSRRFGSEASTSSNDNNLDLHEGYLLLYDLFTPGLEVQAGRFEMAFGSGRQVGRDEWGNVGRAFDGARIAYRLADKFRVDVFGAVVRDYAPRLYDHPEPTLLGASAPLSVSQSDQNFYGLYATIDFFKPLVADIYGFYLMDNTTGAARDIGTVGLRAVAKPVAGLKVEGEAAVQFGAVDVKDPDGKLIEARHLATAYHLDASYEAPVALSPSLSLAFDSASGDANPQDDKSVAYQPLFGSRHGFFGIADLFNWQGVWLVGPGVGLKPHSTVTVKMDYRYVGLATGKDGGDVRAFDGVARFEGGESSSVGHEIDLTASWRPMEWLSFDAGYALFKPGAATKGTRLLVGNEERVLGGDLAHFGYVQAILGI